MVVNIDGLTSLSDFVQSPNRLFIDVWARTGQGKSFYPLSWPQPIIIFNYEPEGPMMSLQNAIRLGVVEEKSDIHVVEPVEMVMGKGDAFVRTDEQDKAIYELTVEILEDITNDVKEGTLVIDTMTSFFEILASATMSDIIKKRERQKKELFGYDWKFRNRAFRRVIEGVRSKTKLNLVTLEHANPMYDGAKPMKGRFQSSAPGRLDQWVDMTAKLEYAPEDGAVAGDPRNWIMWFEKTRTNMALQKLGLDNPTHERLLAAIAGEMDDELLER